MVSYGTVLGRRRRNPDGTVIDSCVSVRALGHTRRWTSSRLVNARNRADTKYPGSGGMREETLAAEPITATTSKRMKNRRFALKGIVLGSVIAYQATV
jgi:hypothetical protein